jgi:hypothetical protein
MRQQKRALSSLSNDGSARDEAETLRRLDDLEAQLQRIVDKSSR